MVPGLSAEQFGWREAKKVEGVGDLIRQIIRIHRREEKTIANSLEQLIPMICLRTRAVVGTNRMPLL